jgi:hypothetical protein
MHNRIVGDKYVRILSAILGEATFHAAYGQHRLTQFNSTSACPLAKGCPFVVARLSNFLSPIGARRCAEWLPVDLKLSKYK